MGLTKQEKLDRVFDHAMQLRALYEKVNYLKSEIGNSNSDFLQEIVDMALKIK